jgi:hypothetical protein
MNFSPAYHLRTNKTVERLLFIELLHRLNQGLSKCDSAPIEKYTYVGLGGPYLEDFNLMHSSFGLRKMISLEKKKWLLTRQVMNQPCSGIDLTAQTTTRFVESLQLGRTPLIAWFDYETQDWKEQMDEFCDLIQKAPSMSVLKVTFSGSTRKLRGQNITERAAAFTEDFGDYGHFTSGDIKPEKICDTLFQIFRTVIAERAPDAKRRSVRSLASYQYNDGTPMLTSTMIVGPLNKINTVIAGIRNWHFSSINWHRPKEIAVPALSLREKLAVDQLLPAAHPRTVINKLGLRFEDRYQDSIDVIARYVQLYRHAPYFAKLAL